jgi:tetratricopeptide (TPR) repeat protein
MVTATATADRSVGAKLATRLPRVLIPYVGGTWGVVQFIDWATNRYLLSPFLVDFAVSAALLLLPAIVLLAYFRGDGGRPWTRAEKLGIPLNLTCAAALLVVLFHGKELGALTRRVAVTGGDGQTVERQIPKSAFRKHVALFFFANDTGDTQLDWVGQALTRLSELDLSQDLFVDAQTQYDYASEIKRAGAEAVSALPLALDQRIARENNRELIVFGRFHKEGEDWIVDISLSPTERGAPTAERRHRGPDLFKLVDALTAQLRKDLGVPASYVDSSPDLPVAEISTHSLPALRAHVLGMNAWKFANDAATAIAKLEESVRIDPQYAVAATDLWEVYFQSNQESRQAAIVPTIKRNEYRLPERTRLEFSVADAVLGERPDEELRLLTQWTTLYPDDILAHRKLAWSYLRRGRTTEADAEARRIVALDPGNPDHLLLAGSIAEIGDEFAAALDSYSAYVKRVPGDVAGYVRVGGLQARIGRLDDARRTFEKAASIAGDRVEPLTNLANIETRLGRFTEAQAALDRAQALAKSDVDRLAVIGQATTLALTMGRAADVGTHAREAVRIADAAFSVPDAAEYRSDAATTLALAGHVDEGRKLVDEMLRHADNPNLRLGALDAAVEVDLLAAADDAAAAHLAELEKLQHAYVIASLTPTMEWLRGRLAEDKGDCAGAVAHFEAASHHGTNGRALVALAGCQRKLRRFSAAHDALAHELARNPADAYADVELAHLYADEGAREKAAAAANAALTVWARADAGYKPAADARAFAATLAH